MRLRGKPVTPNSNNANDAERQAREEAHKSLATLGTRAADAQRALSSIMTDTGLDGGTNYLAASALTLTFGDNESGINRLVTALHDPLYIFRSNAIERLKTFPEHAGTKAVPELIALVENPPYLGQSLADTAAAALGTFGKAAKPAIPVLLKVLRAPDQFPSSRAAAFAALAGVAPENGAEAIQIVVADSEKNPGTQNILHNNLVLLSIPRFGPAARAALPALKKLAASNDEPECYTAASAVKEIEKAAAEGK